ncbi:MAG: hypothetical protein AB1756_01990 [Acidobacteriota bacterium]
MNSAPRKIRLGMITLIVFNFLPIYFTGASEDPEPQKMDICHSCFWQYQPEGLKDKIVDFYRGYRCGDFFLKGEISYMLGTMIPDESLLKDSIAFYNFSLAFEKDPFRRMLLYEIMGMLAPRVSLEAGIYFREASKLSKKLGMKWRSQVFKSLASGGYIPQFGEVTISRNLAVPSNPDSFILGESSIKIRRRARVGIQLERTFRDWLSCQFRYDFSGDYLRLRNILEYHEGARMGDLMEYAQAVPIVLLGSILAYKDGKWFAPDEKGVFRFQILDDKVQYPTTKQYKNVALMIDTHGTSAVVEQAIREKVDLVIACGDNPPKAQAAYYLASRGVNVYSPCDREIGMLLGHDAQGVILGTAPIRETEDGAVIGGQPIKFSVKEKFVVQDIKEDSIARYYDAPARYFQALGSYVPLNLHTVKISGLSETDRVIEEADRIGAKAVGIRVYSEEDYASVKRWLQSSKENRAVLFHSAPYKPGYQLFFEFPDQVTFGDPRPRFIGA